MSGRPGIVVDFDLLGDSAKALASISVEFEHAAKIKDDLVGFLGSGEIAEAMGDFTSNWDHKRADLTENINTTKDAVHLAMASFSEQDKKAAKIDLSHRSGPTMTTTKAGR